MTHTTETIVEEALNKINDYGFINMTSLKQLKEFEKKTWIDVLNQHTADTLERVMSQVDSYVDNNVEDKQFNRQWLKQHLLVFLKSLTPTDKSDKQEVKWHQNNTSV